MAHSRSRPHGQKRGADQRRAESHCGHHDGGYQSLLRQYPPQRAADAAHVAVLPFWVVRMAFAGYSLHRHLRVGKVLGGAIGPATIIVAGVVSAFMAVGLAGRPETRLVLRQWRLWLYTVGRGRAAPLDL